MNSWMVSGWKEPVQNLTRIPLIAEISEEGSVESARWSISYVQLVGPDRTLEFGVA